MSLIKPFCGIRPKKKLAKQVTSPNISYIDNYKPNKKLNYLNLLNSSNINKSKKILNKDTELSKKQNKRGTFNNSKAY